MEGILKCYCGGEPYYEKESEDLHALNCKKCGFTPDRYYKTKQSAIRGWNSWVRNPRRWRIEKGER